MASMNSKGMKGATHSKVATTTSTPIPINPSPDAETTSAGVQIPYIKIKDNPKQLPTYTTALTRPPDEALPAEDLDTVQLELETLLSNVALRYRVLKAEYDSLDKDERRRTKHALAALEHRQPHSPTSASTSTGKRKREESGNNRKLKYITSSTTKNLKHSKHSPAAIHTDDSMDYTPTVSGHGHGHHREHMQKASLPKNDTPNKFWLSVEPYCMPVTNEDLRLLDDLLDRYSGPLVPPIPDLGPHYSNVWAAEDMKEVQQASNPNSHSNRLKQQNNAATAILKKADSITDKCVMGQLTQRLVSALMEEQMVQNPSDLATAESSNSSSENTQSSSRLNFRSLSLLRNCIDIEKRVKKELIEQGILEMEDFPNENDDEVLAEINRVVTELKAIAEHNKSALKRLKNAAQEEMKRLDIKRKLDAIDQDILEMFKRTVQNKSKRKLMTGEEEEEIFRLTAEQIHLSEELERVQENCILFD